MFRDQNTNSQKMTQRRNKDVKESKTEGRIEVLEEEKARKEIMKRGNGVWGLKHKFWILKFFLLMLAMSNDLSTKMMRIK